MTPERRGRRILTRVFLLVALGMVGPLAVVAFGDSASQDEFERRLLMGRGRFAAQIATRLETLLSTELEALEGAAGWGRLELAGNRDDREGAVLRDALLRRRALFESFFLLDGKGTALAQEPASNAAVVGPVLVAEATRAGRPLFTGLFADTRGDLHCYALVPVRTWQGALAGVVGGAINPQGPQLNAIFKDLRLLPGESVDLLDGRGLVIASTERARLLHPSDHAARIAALIAERREESAVWDGELVAFAPLGLPRWGLTVRQPAAGALGLPGALSGKRLWAAAALLGVALLFAFGAASSVTRPLAALTAAAERITAGELATPIPSLPEDEVGRLGQALERMRAALEESLARVDRANAGLEKRVADRTEDLRRLNHALMERQATVHQLLAKVIDAQEHERRRVARELHDETSQGLLALVLRLRAALEKAPQGELRERLELATGLAVGMVDGVHRMIGDLRPSVLDDLGLKSAILWYAERHLERQGLAVRCEFAGLDGRLPPQHETVVFRVIQEAITNIGRHAKAESVLIQAAIREGELKVDIEDDGVGFDQDGIGRPGSDGRGWGLLGMRERVEMLGGKLHIISAEGKGTHLELWVPLPGGA